MERYDDICELCTKLGYSEKYLYKMSNSLDKHYRKVNLIKKNGKIRTLRVPDKYLKSIQKRIAKNLLESVEISKYATAYRVGKSTVDNANPHIGNSILLKLDIRNFFDSIIYSVVKDKVFVENMYSEKIRILLSILCVYEHTVPQGAPTSPIISNIILKEFDEFLGKWCEDKKIIYTRYCDDMTFSGEFEPKEVIKLVRKELFKHGFFLNEKKTVILRKGQRKEVTGIVINEKLSIPKNYKKKIRQEMYYCKKYGVRSNINTLKLNLTKEEYINSLLGRVNYVLSVEKGNEEMMGYKNWLIAFKKSKEFNVFKTKKYRYDDFEQMNLSDYACFCEE